MDLATERSAIRRLRGMYPREGQWVLARRIRANEFALGTAAELLGNKLPIGRTLYSIYSVIRRYDARRKQRKTVISPPHGIQSLSFPQFLRSYRDG